MRKSIIPATIIALALAGCGASSLEESTDTGTTEASQSTDTGGVVEESDTPEPAAEEGTYDNPFPYGTTLKNDSLKITLGKTEVNVNDKIKAANEFNDPAPKGMVYNRVKVTIVNIGKEKVTPWLDASIKFVSADGTSYENAFVAGDELKNLDEMNDLYPKGKGSGYFYFAAPKGAIKTGLYSVSSGFGDESFVKAN